MKLSESVTSLANAVQRLVAIKKTELEHSKSCAREETIIDLLNKLDMTIKEWIAQQAQRQDTANKRLAAAIEKVRALVNKQNETIKTLQGTSGTVDQVDSDLIDQNESIGDQLTIEVENLAQLTPPPIETPPPNLG